MQRPRRARRPRVTFVMPYLNDYRRPFFERLRKDLDEAGVDLSVAYGRPYLPEAVARADAADLDGATELAQHAVRFGHRALVYKRLGALNRASDVLVVDQSLRNVELFPQLVRQALGRGPAVAMWDHGRTYSKAQTGVEQAAKFALTRRARWFFSYTDGGADAVVAHGFPRERTTVVQNTVDTSGLRDAYARVTDGQLAALRAQLGLTPGRTALYIGALAPNKDIPFLLEAAEIAASLLPGFRLIVAGDGAHRGLVEAAADRSPAIVPVGQAFGERKALLGAASEVLFTPGALGLSVTDSFALRTPTVATPHPFHGPEHEYLEHGRNALVVPADPHTYARAVTDLLAAPERLAAMQTACHEDADRYTVEEMSRRFAEGLVRLLRGDGDRPTAAGSLSQTG